MIAIMGGTSESETIIHRLAAARRPVIHFTTTATPLASDRIARVERRVGALTALPLARLLKRRRVRVLIDATHPYAVKASRTAEKAARGAGIPLLLFQRRPLPIAAGHVRFAETHAGAARLAVRLARAGRASLLTIGSHHLRPYVRAAKGKRRLVARVLPGEASLAAARAAGMRPDDLIVGRGPFSCAANRRHIRGCGATVLVTKESGRAGGFREKLAAAHAEGIAVIVVRRPPAQRGGFQRTADLARAALRIVEARA